MYNKFLLRGGVTRVKTSIVDGVFDVSQCWSNLYLNIHIITVQLWALARIFAPYMYKESSCDYCSKYGIIFYCKGYLNIISLCKTIRFNSSIVGSAQAELLLFL